MNLNHTEKKALTAFYGKGSSIYLIADPDSRDGWLCFGLFLLLSAGTMVRKMRLGSMGEQVSFKQDGSPVTTTDKTIELFFRESFKRFCPAAGMLGEETGGSFTETGYSVAVDPIDGTWGFINRTETCATSLLILKDKIPVLGMVLNPVSGEICYGGDSFNTRLLQLSLFKEGEQGHDLPLDKVLKGDMLVNLHPQRHAGSLLDTFYTQWEKGDIRMVRSPGGSPAYALLEAAKGTFGYVNLWGKKKSSPYDLAAGILLVRNAGGDVIDFDGNPVRLLDHEGPFIAGIDPDTRKRLLMLCQNSLDLGGTAHENQ
jgi:myo-inositol-1(or 4)-monophosphatase